MNVLLVQPPEPQAPIEPVGSSVATADVFSTPWDFLCLQTFLLERSRHTCRLLDTRLSNDLEADLVSHLETTPAPRVLAVHATSLGLGPVAAVLDIAKRAFPDLVTVLFGQHPSQFPESALGMPRVDYALAGDPEPILRNLLDCLDTPPRLQRVPGLIMQGKDDLEPYWLDHLRSLVPGDWKGVFWNGYEIGLAHRICRAEIRLSRGSANTPPDRPFGKCYEPLRTWSFDKVAAKIMQAGPHGINEVFVNDSPGFWTWERLSHWIEALHRVRNVQPWGMRILPAALDEDTIARLAYVGCRRMQIIYPSCDMSLLNELGCTALPGETASTVDLLAAYGITSQVRFWVGGPEESPGEKERILKVLKKVDPAGFSMEAYPLRLDSPDYRRLGRVYAAPGMDAWLDWARDPWLHERPMALWGGEEKQVENRRVCQSVIRQHRHSPHLVLRRAIEGVRNFSLAELFVRHAQRADAPRGPR